MECEINRQATVAAVLTGLRQDVLLGLYDEKKQISETEVAKKYQVSRSSVRSAFQALERDGLLEVQPNGRKLLRRVDPKYIEDLCLTRSILESEAACLILERENTDFSMLLQIVAQFHAAQHSPQGRDNCILLAQINEKFHDQLFIMAQNSALLQCRRTIAPMLSAIVELNATLDRNLNVHGYYESHKKIAEMLMEKDESVIEYIRYHAREATLKDVLMAIKQVDKKDIE